MVQKNQPEAEKAQTAEEERNQEAAAAVILEYDRKRRRRSRRKARKRRLEAEARHHVAMERMQQSIEVIKWCILSISAVMVISLVTGLIVLHQVKTEVESVKAQVEKKAERIQGEVERIRNEAEKIRDKIRHPLETLGGFAGRKLDSNITDMLGGKE